MPHVSAPAAVDTASHEAEGAAADYAEPDLNPNTIGIEHEHQASISPAPPPPTQRVPMGLSDDMADLLAPPVDCSTFEFDMPETPPLLLRDALALRQHGPGKDTGVSPRHVSRHARASARAVRRTRSVSESSAAGGELPKARKAKMRQGGAAMMTAARRNSLPAVNVLARCVWAFAVWLRFGRYESSCRVASCWLLLQVLSFYPLNVYVAQRV